MRSWALLSILCTVVLAADTVQFQLSKINFAKKRSWDALASNWMSGTDLKHFVDQQSKANRQLIFLEYNGVQYRGLFTGKIKYSGSYYLTLPDQASMALELTKYRAEGFEASYIYQHGGKYTAVVVAPADMVAARKLLDELGIGPPTVK